MENLRASSLVDPNDEYFYESGYNEYFRKTTCLRFERIEDRSILQQMAVGVTSNLKIWVDVPTKGHGEA